MTKFLEEEGVAHVTTAVVAGSKSRESMEISDARWQRRCTMMMNPDKRRRKGVISWKYVEHKRESGTTLYGRERGNHNCESLAVMSAIILIKNNSSLLPPTEFRRRNWRISVFSFAAASYAIGLSRPFVPAIRLSPVLFNSNDDSFQQEILESIDRSIDRLGKRDCKCPNTGREIDRTFFYPFFRKTVKIRKDSWILFM